MSVQRGYNILLGGKEETTFGVAPSGAAGNPITYDYIGHLVGFTPSVSPSPIEINPIGTRFPVAILRGELDVGLSIEFNPIYITYLQYALANINKSFTVWEKLVDVNADLVYTGCKVNRLRLRGEVGRPLVATMDLVGRNVSTTAPSHANLPAIQELAPMHFPDQGITLGGSALSGIVNAFEVEIDNDIEKIHRLGDVLLQTSVEKLIKVTGSITMTVAGLTELSDVLSLAVKQNLVISLGRDGGNQSRSLTISRIVWSGYPKPVRVGDVLRVTLPFMSLRGVPTLA